MYSAVQLVYAIFLGKEYCSSEGIKHCQISLIRCYCCFLNDSARPISEFVNKHRLFDKQEQNPGKSTRSHDLQALENRLNLHARRL